MRLFKLGTTLVFSVILLLSVDYSQAQTAVTVPIGTDTHRQSPPDCPFPCNEKFQLPRFARSIAIAGPDGFHKTKLSRGAFYQQLEAWRKFMEIYRLSIEKKRQSSNDWSAANITYLVEIGKYDQFIEAYRAATLMDRAGHISFGKNKS